MKLVPLIEYANFTRFHAQNVCALSTIFSLVSRWVQFRYYEIPSFGNFDLGFMQRHSKIQRTWLQQHMRGTSLCVCDTHCERQPLSSTV